MLVTTQPMSLRWPWQYGLQVAGRSASDLNLFLDECADAPVLGVLDNGGFLDLPLLLTDAHFDQLHLAGFDHQPVPIRLFHLFSSGAQCVVDHEFDAVIITVADSCARLIQQSAARWRQLA